MILAKARQFPRLTPTAVIVHNTAHVRQQHRTHVPPDITAARPAPHPAAQNVPAAPTVRLQRQL